MTMPDSMGTGPTDPNEKYEDQIARGKDHQPVNLSEGQNKEPPQAVSFKVTGGGK